MSKVFNVTGACNPAKHYMVDITERLVAIKELVDKGAYFTMNRARQYGKTTTLRELCKYLRQSYYVVYIDFQSQMSNAKFRDENTFSIAFAKAFVRKFEDTCGDITDSLKAEIAILKNEITNNKDDIDLVELFLYLSNICKVSDKPIILIVDEVDSATNNQVFLDFLAQLRGYYLDREYSPIFQSVILAGVYDVKNIKRKIRPDEEKKVNSPWNIATKFDIDMSFGIEDIKGMINEYEIDNHTDMDIPKMAQLIYDYTSGYPFLVSRICQILDEEVEGMAWNKEGFLEAIKIILTEKNALFESLVNKLTDYSEIRNIVYDILFNGKDISYTALNKSIDTAEMFGFIVNQNNKVVISNRIFETILYDYFLSNEIIGNKMYDVALCDKNQFIYSGHLNMKLVLEKFVETFDYIYGDENEKFKEEVGRKYFMLFLKPIINGTGNSYIEARTRNMKRTDIIVDYLGEQFVIELKIWSGQKYNEDGERQVAEYMEYYHLDKGYMLTFNFNKKKNIGVNEIKYGDKVLVEAVV
jgi:hypothetical protein